MSVGFLEQEPSVHEALDAAQGRTRMAVGLFADRGPHGEADVLARLGGARGRTAYAGPIGGDPAMARIVLDQVRQSDLKAVA